MLSASLSMMDAPSSHSSSSSEEETVYYRAYKDAGYTAQELIKAFCARDLGAAGYMLKDLGLTDEIVDLYSAQVDIAFRTGKMPDSALLSVRLGDVRARVRAMGCRARARVIVFA